jgi:hypothetical protein
LKNCLERALAAELKLELNEKTQIFPIRNGVDYLSWHFLTKTGKVVKKLRNSTKKRRKNVYAGYRRVTARAGWTLAM